MLTKILQPLLGAKGGALFDSPPVGDHHRQRYAAIFGTPPARYPITAALLLRSAIGKKGNQRLPR